MKAVNGLKIMPKDVDMMLC